MPEEKGIIQYGMAVTLEVFAQRFASLKEFITKEMSRIMNEKSALIEEMQRRRLSKGKNIKDKTIQKGYSPGYAKRRKNRGLQTNYVDLNFTGEFYESLEIKELPTEGEFQTVSYVDYAKYIVDKYVDVLGVNESDAKRIKKIITDELSKTIKQYLVG